MFQNSLFGTLLKNNVFFLSSRLIPKAIRIDFHLPKGKRIDQRNRKEKTSNPKIRYKSTLPHLPDMEEVAIYANPCNTSTLYHYLVIFSTTDIQKLNSLFQAKGSAQLRTTDNFKWHIQVTFRLILQKVRSVVQLLVNIAKYVIKVNVAKKTNQFLPY